METILYRCGNDYDLDAMIKLYRDSRLGERRPVDQRSIMQAMRDHADLTITAWAESHLIGIARTLTDFAYVAYLADLAVHAEFQRQGVGRRLIEETRQQLEPSCILTLLAAPDANDYYARLGFEHNPRAWMLKSSAVIR